MLSNILDGEEVVLTGITQRIVSLSRLGAAFSLPPRHNRNILDFLFFNSVSVLVTSTTVQLFSSTVQPFSIQAAGIGFGIWMQKMAPYSVFEPNPSHPLLAPQCYIYLWRVTFLNGSL